MTAVSMAEFARILGVHRSTVTRARQSGRLVLDAQGLVLVDESLARYHATSGGRTDMAERHAEARGAALPEPQQPATAKQQPSSAETEQPEGQKRYQRDRLQYENAAIRLEQALRRHERYVIADVQKQGEILGNTPRAAVERLIDELTPQLLLARPERRRALILAEVRRVRRLVKRERLRALRRLREGRAR
ncbi:MAG: hypothetical protein JJU06_05865 [Ectothiorhodospiraceae bacterium]|nr:hypothetical protein [Ectothiorhodospiraceae bacterium]MCH8502898.1 hypothetical protein [Ectothiorhodospiraceae bacterium]